MQEHYGDWDFTVVIDLIFSLSPATADTPPAHVPPHQLIPALPPDEPVNGGYQLGNFDSLWRFLGQPLDVPPPKVTPLLMGAQQDGDNQEDAFGCKGVRWRDEVEGADLEDNDEVEGSPNDVGAIDDSFSGLTKGQRKKERRRQRKALGALSVVQANTAPISSDNESDKEQKLCQSDDRKSVIHEILHGSLLKPNGHYVREPIMTPVKNGWPISNPLLNGNHAPPSSPKNQEEQVFEEATFRKSILMKMLHEKFVDERQFLRRLNVLQHALIGKNGTFDGIHVFVDASNVSVQIAQGNFFTYNNRL